MFTVLTVHKYLIANITIVKSYLRTLNLIGQEFNIQLS